MGTVVNMLDGEFNPVLLKKLTNDSYTRESLNLYKRSTEKIVNTFFKIGARDAFDALKEKFIQAYMAQSRKLARKERYDLKNPLVKRAISAIKRGEYVVKYHFTTNGKHKQFFKLLDEVTLRWTSKEKNIQKLRACHSYHLKEIKGLVYGKATKTFNKKKNAKLEPWLCFSIILKSRPFDMYCEEERINDWVIGLSYLIKKNNPDAYCLTIGQFFWRKLKFVMNYLVLMSMPKNKRKKIKKDISFCKTILLYKQLRYDAKFNQKKK